MTDSTPLCARDDCDRPAPAGRLCTVDYDRLRRQLASLPQLIRELETTVTGQATTNGRGLDWNASDVAWTVGRTIRAWTLTLIAAGTPPPRRKPRTPARVGPVHDHCRHQSCAGIRRDATTKPLDQAAYLAAWLHTHTPDVNRLPIAGQLADEIDWATGQAQYAVDTRLARVALGTCWNTTATGPCGTDLWARDGQQIITCPNCGAVYDVSVRRAGLLLVAEDTLMTAAEVARTLPDAYGVDVTHAAIRTWIHRGRVPDHGVNGDGRRLYRVGDVLDVARAAVTRPKRRRTAA